VRSFGIQNYLQKSFIPEDKKVINKKKENIQLNPRKVLETDPEGTQIGSSSKKTK
jgi:hypothetical protein